VFARLPPLARRRPFDTSQPCFFLKQEKTLVFQKNQEKDVWHALLSFQGTGPRGFLPADDAVPPAFSQEQIYRPKTETLSLCDIPHSCQWFRCPLRTPRPNEGLKRTKNPCGDAQYRVWSVRVSRGFREYLQASLSQ
jgi:hypothetical protein